MADSLPESLLDAIDGFRRAAKREGLEQGLWVAEQIRSYLTEKPDTARQRRHREWADKLIAKAREDANG